MQYFVLEQQFEYITLSQSYYRFNAWMAIEMLYIPALIIVNILFLFIRSLRPAMITVTMPSMLQTDESDFLIGFTTTLRSTINLLVPAFMTLIVRAIDYHIERD